VTDGRPRPPVWRSSRVNSVKLFQPFDFDPVTLRANRAFPPEKFPVT
jgi:hypothetical protein